MNRRERKLAAEAERRAAFEAQDPLERLSKLARHAMQPRVQQLHPDRIAKLARIAAAQAARRKQHDEDGRTGKRKLKGPWTGVFIIG